MSQLQGRAEIRAMQAERLPRSIEGIRRIESDVERIGRGERPTYHVSVRLRGDRLRLAVAEMPWIELEVDRWADALPATRQAIAETLNVGERAIVVEFAIT